MKATYKLSAGLRKALWQAGYLGLAAGLDAVVQALTNSTEAKTWPIYPVVVGACTMLGNWLKVRRTIRRQ